MNTAQESTYLDLTVNTSDAAAAAANSDNSAAGETVSLIFPDADRRRGSDSASHLSSRYLGTFLGYILE